jgi:hypothetical protein
MDLAKGMLMLYFIRRHSDMYIKIGITINIHNRINTLSREHGELSLMGWIAGYRDIETQLHRKFAEHRADGEFFIPVPPITDYIDKYACPIPYDEFEFKLYDLWAYKNSSEGQMFQQRQQILALKSRILQLEFEAKL